jgi:WD40 repeat protein
MIRAVLLAAALLAGFQDPKPAARVDLAGDALPDGAIARLGTKRWRTPGRVWSLAFGKDARSLLVGAGTTLLLWDVEKNQRVRAFPGHRGVVGSIALHPDGERALTGAGDGTMALWNLKTGERLRSFTGHEGRVWTAALSKDGSLALSAGMDGSIGLWKTDTGERTQTLKAHKGSVNCAVFLDGDTRILSGGADGRLILWDAATGAKLKSVPAHAGEISGLSVGPDGKTIVTTSGKLIPGDEPETNEGTMAVWDLESGRRRKLIRHRAGFLWSAFAGDARTVIAACADRSAALWDLESGDALQTFEGLGDRTHPIAVRDGIVAIGDGTAVALFDASTGKRRFDVPGHSDSVGGVGFLPDGRAVTAGADGWIALWEASTGRRVRMIDTGALEFGSLALSATGQLALTGGWRAAPSLWNLETGALVRTFEGRSARGVVLGPKTAVTGLLDGSVLVSDLDTGTPVRRWKGSVSGAVALRPDGKLALVPAAPKSAAVIDVETGQQVRALDGHGRDVLCMAFAPDGSRAATGGGDGFILLWDGDCAKETGRLEAGAPVRALAFGPNGLLAAGHGSGVSVWDAAGKRLASFQGHSGGVTSVAIDSAGRRVLSGSGDTTALVWEIPAR